MTNIHFTPITNLRGKLMTMYNFINVNVIKGVNLVTISQSNVIIIEII